MHFPNIVARVLLVLVEPAQAAALSVPLSEAGCPLAGRLVAERPIISEAFSHSAGLAVAEILARGCCILKRMTILMQNHVGLFRVVHAAVAECKIAGTNRRSAIKRVVDRNGVCIDPYRCVPKIVKPNRLNVPLASSDMKKRHGMLETGLRSIVNELGIVADRWRKPHFRLSVHATGDT